MAPRTLLRAAAALAVALPAAPGAAAGASGGDARAARRAYETLWADRMIPLVEEAIRFDTVAGQAEAFARQRAWLRGAAAALGLTVRDGGPLLEVELPGPEGAPVVGLLVHGDVVAVDPREWTSPPFSPSRVGDRIRGRGSADDKGPLVQALLAMAALRSSGVERTHAIRLVVGEAEETAAAKEMEAYLAARPPPDVTLVLDATFPVVVGEKAWTELVVATPLERPGAGAVEGPAVTALEAGVGTSIVPDRAELALRWSGPAPAWEPWLATVRARALPEGTRLAVEGEGPERTLRVTGRSAHAGMALREGRNALVALAGAVDGLLPPSGAADLLAFAKLAGSDLDGAGLGLPRSPPPWNGFETNVATVRRAERGLALAVNIRAPPALHGAPLRAHLEERVREFDARTGAHLAVSRWYSSEPLVIDPESKLVKRLLAAYARGAGRAAAPLASPGGSYAKHVPRSVAFGMWFPDDGPYPGHGADELVPVASLHRGVAILLEALADLACGPPMERPLER